MSKTIRLTTDRRLAVSENTARMVRTSSAKRVAVVSGTSVAIRFVEQLRVALTSNQRSALLVETQPRRVTVAIAGIRGPASGSTSAFTHTQTTPQAAWLVVHNLGRQPIINVVINNEVVDARISYPNTSSALLEFTSPQSGKAYCF
jgi:hypothetical protein